jgi:hypothetical protein
MASHCDIKESAEKLTIYAKFLSGNILSMEMKPDNTVQTIYSKISHEIQPMHENLIQLFFSDETKFYTNATMIHKIINDGDSFMVFINQPVIELYDEDERLRVDDYNGHFSKYSLKVLSKPSVTKKSHINLNQIYQIDFWYNKQLNLFCEDSFYEETDKNRRTREFVTYIYAEGLVTANYQKFFQKIVPEKYCQFVVDNFEYDKFISENVSNIMI